MFNVCVLLLTKNMVQYSIKEKFNVTKLLNCLNLIRVCKRVYWVFFRQQKNVKYITRASAD